MAEARHKPPMQPWLAPVSNRLFGWTENGCEGTSPSAELRFQHSASPPSAAGRFPPPDTLPPRLPRARPPSAAPPRPLLVRPAAAPVRAGRAGCTRRGAGLGGPAVSWPSPRLPGAGIWGAAEVCKAFFPRCLPGPLRSGGSRAPPFQPPPSPTWSCHTCLGAAGLRLALEEGETKGRSRGPGRHPSRRVDLNGSYLLDRLQHLVFSLCPCSRCQMHSVPSDSGTELRWSLFFGFHLKIQPSQPSPQLKKLHPPLPPDSPPSPNPRSSGN